MTADHSPASRVAAVEDSDQRAAYAAFIEEWEQQRRTIQSNADDMEAPMRAFGHALCSVRPKRCYPVMSIALRALLYLAPHFDVSYMDFMVAFNRSPAQAMDDLLDLEDDFVQDYSEGVASTKAKLPKAKIASVPCTDSKHSPKRVQPASSTDGTSPPTDTDQQNSQSKSDEKKKQNAEVSPGSKRQAGGSPRDKKK